MADVQTLLAQKADKTYPLSPWLDPSFNTCILDPTPQIDDMLDTAVAEEAQQVGTQVGDAKDCLWEKAGDAIFNKNQGGRVLVNTKEPSVLGATFTASRGANPGSVSKVSEIRNTASAIDMAGTGSMLFWTFKHPEVEGQAAAGGVTVAMEANWSLTAYNEFQYFQKAGTQGTGPENYWNPFGICSDGTFIYVADLANNRVKKILRSDLTFVTSIGSPGTGNDQFSRLYDIAYAGGYIYCLDSGGNSDRVVKRKASDLSYVTKYGTYGSGNDNLNGALGIACDGTYVYVSDGTNMRIVKRLASDLTYVSQVGSYGSGNDQFFYPQGLFTDGTYLWVVDSGNNRIHIRKCSDLSYVGKFGSYGTGIGQFASPSGVSVFDKYIYVADTGNYRIQKFLKTDYSYQSKYGTSGSGDDNLNDPQSILIEENLIYISDPGNARIMVRVIAETLSTYFLEFNSYMGFNVAKKGIVKEVGRFTSDGYLALGQYLATERLDLVGNARVSGQYISWMPTGTMPVNVTSTTKCTNLNADMVDGVHAASLTASRIAVVDASGYLNVNAALTAPTFPYASGAGSLADSAFYRVSASVYSIGGPAGVTDPATWHFTVWNPASSNVVMGVCQDTAAYYADIAVRNAGGDKTWIWSLRASGASPTPYAFECWHHDGTSWASAAYLRIAPTGVVTCTVSLTIAALSGILIATAGAVTVITDSHANWDTAYANRVDTWTSPLALSSNTASIGGLSSIGTANYTVGVNAAGNSWEYKNLIAGTNVTITHAAGSVTIASSAAGAAHAILSSTHDDTTAAAVVRGDMIVGVGATPKWTRVPTVAAGSYWASGTDPAWATLNQAAVAGLTTASSPTFAGLTVGALAGILIGTAGVVSAITNNSANWDTAYGWGNHAGAGYLTSVTPHNILSATHGDTTAASVVRGDMIVGVGATPKWERLADVAAGAYFRSGGVGLEPLWSTLILPNAGTIYRLPVFSAANTMTELAAVGATGEYLKGNTGAIPSWATLNQAAVAGLTTASSPEFVTVKCSGLTDGYIPYHVSDAAGLANGPIFATGASGSAVLGSTSNLALTKLELVTVLSQPAPTLGVGSGLFGLSLSGAYGLCAGIINTGNVWFQVQRFDATATAYNLLLQPSGGSVIIGATALVGSEIFRVDGGTSYFDHGVYRGDNGLHFDQTSDERAKENIMPYALGLKELLRLQPKSFEFNGKMGTEDGRKGFGLVAQDVQKIIPEAVTKEMKKLNKYDTEDTETLGLSVGDHVHYILINSVKELEARLRKLEGN